MDTFLFSHSKGRSLVKYSTQEIFFLTEQDKIQNFRRVGSYLLRGFVFIILPHSFSLFS